MQKTDLCGGNHGSWEIVSDAGLATSVMCGCGSWAASAANQRGIISDAASIIAKPNHGRMRLTAIQHPWVLPRHHLYFTVIAASTCRCNNNHEVFNHK